MYWNCKRQQGCSDSHVLVPCYVPAWVVLLPMLNVLWQTPGAQNCYNPTHFIVGTCHLDLGEFSPFVSLRVAGWINMFLSMDKAACVHGYDQGWRDTSFSFMEGTEDRYRTERKKEKKKPVTWSIMQAAHLNPSLPGTSTLRARIQPTCEWAPGHVSRWAWKSAASRPCMCINGGCWGHESQRRMS